MCANLGEAYRKRQYKAHFMSKLSDCDMENAETQVWIEFAYACKYITEENCMNLSKASGNVGKHIGFMIRNPERFLPKT